MSVLQMLTKTLQSGGIDQISSQLGIEPEQVSTVVAGALPTMIGALSKNSEHSGGASALAGALDRDHDGSILDDLAGFLGGGGGGGSETVMSTGAGILKHMLGSRQDAVEQGLGGMAGLDKASVGKIITMLAPIVMGALGKEKRNRGLDAGGLAELLGGEKQRATEAAPGVGGLLGSLLDSDGDGQVGDDIAEIGGKLLGSLFGKR